MLRLRLHECSFEAIAREESLRKPNGSPYTRQRVKQFEQTALHKLGLPAGFAIAHLYGTDRADRAQDMREMARRARPGDFHNLDAGALRGRARQHDRLDQQLDAVTDQLLEEAEERGGLAPERKDYYEQLFTALTRP